MTVSRSHGLGPDAALSVSFSNNDESTAVDLGGLLLVGLLVPNTLPDSSLGFKVAATSTGSYVTLKDHEGNDVEVSVDNGAAACYDVTDKLRAAVRYLKLTCDTNVTGEITLITRVDM